jgi:hypothetical protein
MKQKETEKQETETIKLYAKHEYQEIQVNAMVTTGLSFINVNDHICNNENVILFRINNSLTTSLLNLTNVSPYVILSFDENLEFKGASYIMNSSKGNYSIGTQYKTLLFLRLPNQIKISQITNLKII